LRSGAGTIAGRLIRHHEAWLGAGSLSKFWEKIRARGQWHAAGTAGNQQKRDGSPEKARPVREQAIESVQR
jgi:hypothetical protein